MGPSAYKGIDMNQSIIEKGNSILDDITKRAEYKYDVENNPTAKISYMSYNNFVLTVKTIEEITTLLKQYINNMDTGSYGPKQELQNLTDLRYDLLNYKNVHFPKSKAEIQNSVKVVDNSIENVKSKMREHDDLKMYLKEALHTLELDVKVARLKI